MATAERDLWPTITREVNLNTPLSLLREQAALLKEKTGGLVEAMVKIRSGFKMSQEGLRLSAKANPARDIATAHSFYLAAPALKYNYLLFTSLQPVDMYPMYVQDSPIGDIKVESEEELVNTLQRIFASEKTQKVIQALIAQSLSERSFSSDE